jgi:hypothetical protein
VSYVLSEECLRNYVNRLLHPNSAPFKIPNNPNYHPRHYSLHNKAIKSENLKETDHLGVLGVDRMLKWISNKYCVRAWTEFILFRTGTSCRICEHGREPLGSIKGWEFLDRLSDH